MRSMSPTRVARGVSYLLNAMLLFQTPPTCSLIDEGKTLSLFKTRTKFYQRKLNALEPEKQAVTPGHLAFSRPIGDVQKLPNPHAIS